jgi:hypothetical protein
MSPEVFYYESYLIKLVQATDLSDTQMPMLGAQEACKNKET